VSKRKIIIGAGISGLIFKYYNPDYTLISPKIGGQIKSKLGTLIVLHDTNETRSLLNDLKVPYKSKIIRIGYFYKSEFHNNISKEQKIKIINKKLTHSLFKIGERKEIYKLVLSVDSNELKYLECDVNILLKKLIKNTEIIKKKVVLISLKNNYITLSNYDKFYFDSLISTIPAPDFSYLCFDYFFNNKFDYLPSTIISCNEIPSWLIPFEWDQLYYADGDQIYNRITKANLYKGITIKGKYVLEIAGDLSREECKRLLEYKIIDYVIQRVSTIFSERIEDLKSINFVGRLAKWQSDYKIQDVIKFSKEFKDERI